MKILAISDVHGEDNENLYKYLNNNDIDIVKSDLSKAYQDMISGSPDPEVVYDKTIY